MTQQTSRQHLLILLCVIGSLSLVGVTPAMADELPAVDGGTDDACAKRVADAYLALDAFESSLPVDGGLTETDVLGPMQAIISQLNSDLSRMQCEA